MIARNLEDLGLSTICMSSAHSITEAVNPPRAVLLDFPLGHTAGPPDDKALQRKIMIDTLSALDSIQVPGTIRTLPYEWPADPQWKSRLPRPDALAENDDRLPRSPEPQYQTEGDREAAAAMLTAGGCPGCHFPEDEPARRD